MRDASGKVVRAAEKWGQCRGAPGVGLASPCRLQTMKFTLYPKNAFLKTVSNWFARTMDSKCGVHTAHSTIRTQA